jgi:hypothetical protein
VEHIFARIKALTGRLFIRTQLQKRVGMGAIFLNSVKPGWWEQIDLERLDMLDTRLCLCGQLYGRHANAYRVLRLSPADFVLYGFLPAGSDYGKTKGLPQDLLTHLWIKEIKKWRCVDNGQKGERTLKRMNPVGSGNRKLPKY